MGFAVVSNLDPSDAACVFRPVLADSRRTTHSDINLKRVVLTSFLSSPFRHQIKVTTLDLSPSSVELLNVSCR